MQSISQRVARGTHASCKDLAKLETVTVEPFSTDLDYFALRSIFVAAQQSVIRATRLTLTPSCSSYDFGRLARSVSILNEGLPLQLENSVDVGYMFLHVYINVLTCIYIYI